MKNWLFCWYLGHNWWPSDFTPLPFVRINEYGIWGCIRCGKVRCMRVDFDQRG